MNQDKCPECGQALGEQWMASNGGPKMHPACFQDRDILNRADRIRIRRGEAVPDAALRAAGYVPASLLVDLECRLNAHIEREPNDSGAARIYALVAENHRLRDELRRCLRDFEMINESPLWGGHPFTHAVRDINALLSAQSGEMK